jgi:hypothetical protein
MLKRCRVGLKNVYVTPWWAAMPPMLKPTDLDQRLVYVNNKILPPTRKKVTFLFEN